MAKLSRNLQIGLACLTGAALALQAFAVWAIAPFPLESALRIRTATWIAQAPFADRIVIGDSRIEWARPTDEALFVGYGSATYRNLERVTQVICAISDAPVTIGLGVNDAKPSEFDLRGTLASAERMIDACKDDGITLAKAWAVEPDVPPAGQLYDHEALVAIDSGLDAIGEAHDIRVLDAPALAGHTIDGVHFTDEVSRRYLSQLAAAAVRP